MIRIDLGVRGLGRVRFAASPLDTAKDLLFTLARTPQVLGPRWRDNAVRALEERQLGLLAAVAGGGPLGYAPDFLRPESTGFDMTLTGGLHLVATTPAERVRYELSAALDGHAWDRSPARRPPRLLLAALDRGEEYLAQRIAGEMEQFWHAALAPHWPGIRARLEGEVATRASAIVTRGISDTLDSLAPNLRERDGVLHLTPLVADAHRIDLEADSAVLVPSVFAARAIFCGGEPPGTPARRGPLIVYPAAPTDCLPRTGRDELLGATRVKLLAELSQPHSTGELATRLCLSPATVSYHLQILHRAGLVQRTRRSRTVLYQRLVRTPGAAAVPDREHPST
ncbi:ArsR/SmtB family transcription factor [Streptomyces sp. NRRL WC-3742]|uniref:ArsR/SmtB family transcription factor n=1 Tax=Streptomyces sp. NRRL WC-3742 TaxID=1463934 RepID=UPI0004CBC056|nr:ArsR family transcriptional regulator [Streptomyces sp. NRRL WC-3742]